MGCVSQKDMWKSQRPAPQNVTSFGNGVVVDAVSEAGVILA